MDEQKQAPCPLHMEVAGVDRINYALNQNKIPVIRQVTLVNRADCDLQNVILKIQANPAFALPLEKVIQLIPTGQTLVLDEIDLVLETSFLSALTERLLGTLQIELHHQGECLVAMTRGISILAFDEWQGTGNYPELLAAFVTPNHPLLAKILVRAADLLEQWTGNPALNAYQNQSANRVRLQAAAIYGALQEQNIIYAVPPASFEQAGQRIRLCHAVLEQHLGTCLDLALLFAACLEAIGLHPLLVMLQGHAFVGLWLEDLTFPETIQDDPSVISKRLTDDISEITVIECTLLTAGKSASFEQAVQSAADTFLNPQAFDFVIDVKRARMSGIWPLPLAITADGGWAVARDLRDESDLTSAPAPLMPAVAVAEGSGSPLSRTLQWERKLLDLSLRNSLLNMHLTRRLVPVLAENLHELEDTLFSDADFAILPRPEEWAHRSDTPFTFDNVHDLGQFKDLIRTEFQNKRLRSVLSESDHVRSIVELYRAAKVALEENGANTLYLTLGTLRWYESAASEKPRYAPIVLLPIEIVRKSAQKGYVIRLRDDEPQANITLLEMLKQDFGITVYGLDPLPQDEKGIDLRSVFATLRRAVMNQARWDIIESSFIGVFSFTQFVMWNDLRNRSDALLQNKIVRSLVEGRLAWPASRVDLGEKVSEDGVLLPIAADASQLQAIHAASQGQSFVLHGPPGTGKSQTITAMIANALANGKSVLFVAEKMAALSVVQSRLKALGLDPFCLELHSSKSHKRDVLEQLRQATEVTRLATAASFNQRAEQARAIRQELDRYALHLHEKRACGYSLHEMINRFESMGPIAQAIHFNQEFALSLRAGDIEQQERLLEQLLAAGQAIGHPSSHPLRTIGRSDYSQQLRTELPELLKAYQAELVKLAAVAQDTVATLALGLPRRMQDWLTLASITEELLIWPELPVSWSRQADLDAYLNGVRSWAGHARTAAQIKSELGQDWTPDFLRQNGVELEDRWRALESQWFLPRLLNRRRLEKQLKPFARRHLPPEKLALAFNLLRQYQAESQLQQQLLHPFGAELGRLDQGEQTDWDFILACCSQAEASAHSLAALPGGTELRLAKAANPAVAAAVQAFTEQWQQTLLEQQRLDQAISLRPDVLPDSDWLAEQQQMCSDILNQMNALKSWMLYRGAADEVEATGIKAVIQTYEAGLEHDRVLPTYRQAVYRALIIATVESEDTLNRFSGPIFNQKIEQYKKLDAELTEITRQEIYCRLAARVPDFTTEAANSSELGILQRAIRSNGRGTSIRHLFELIPNLLPRLCPCMLMSPISAAQYLDPKRAPFDLIIFDEASQIPTSKAVGALARGREAVIVGDPKQMPPTSFFVGSNIDEENIEAEDLESILDDCLALSFPESHLLWHYRSRHESLIAFSNSQFYENKLFTFPSVNDRESKLTFVAVEGCFDRGKTRQNRAEAEAVVAEIVRRFESATTPAQSIGVITFNINQQNLIDDLFTEACARNPALEAWATETGEPLFIKNLENVQGDERDVILFSIGFGADQGGKVFMNFGPLNREGGWRRLNVAVSRARHEMMVFSSLLPDQINLSKTSARGVGALKAFLEYAKSGTLAVSEQASLASKIHPAGVIDTICQALQKAGYRVDMAIGHSHYRIDIGVIDPANPDRYILGILLDGESYGQARTTRDREIAQLKVLAGLGWTIHRIWSMDWWDNKEQEIAALLAKLDTLILQQKAAASDRPAQAIASLQSTGKGEPRDLTNSDQKAGAAPELPIQANMAVRQPEEETKAAAGSASPAQTYVAATLNLPVLTPEDYLSPGRSKIILQAFERVIAAEAPITEALLTRRVLQGFGITRAGSRIQGRTQAILNQLNCRRTAQGNTVLFWRQDQDPAAFAEYRPAGTGIHAREAGDVPLVEVAQAVSQVLAEQIGLPEEDLIRETARKLGYARSGSQVIAMVKGGIQVAVAQGKAVQDGRGNYTK